MQTERAQGMEPGRVERTAGQAKNIFNISFIISTTTTITTSKYWNTSQNINK